jgi:hypothetical protein
MGLFDNLFGKKTSGPTSSTKTTPVSDEAESLRTKNFELQQQLTELQAQLAAVNVSSNNSHEDSKTPYTDTQSSADESEVVTHLVNFSKENPEGAGLPGDDGLNKKLRAYEVELTESEQHKAVLQVANALRQLLTDRLFLDLQGAKLEIVRLCDEGINAGARVQTSAIESQGTRIQELERKLQEQIDHVGSLMESSATKFADQQQLRARVDAAEIENSALKKGVGTEVWELKQELAKKNAEISDIKDDFHRNSFSVQAQAKRLEEREATVNKNLTELQKRESALRESMIAKSGATPEIVADLKAKVNRLERELLAKNVELISLDLNLTEQLESAEKSAQRLGSLLNHKILSWMLEDATPKVANVEHGYLSIMGEGPWDTNLMAQLMEQQGFSLWELPDQDVAHVVVGRADWNADILEEQIDARVGMDLRIYSQEMWFAKLITGRDPFDSHDHDLLMAFAKDHEALQYLLSRDFQWPEVAVKGLIGEDGSVIEPPPPPKGSVSPLHIFGYQVGSTSRLSIKNRRDLLSQFLQAKTLIFDDQSSEAYRTSWGKPRSVQRLYCIAMHINWLIGWQGRDPRKVQANDDWIEDLKWLKQIYYKPTAHRFKWPNSGRPIG